jgi:hypothetical protein
MILPSMQSSIAWPPSTFDNEMYKANTPDRTLPSPNSRPSLASRPPLPPTPTQLVVLRTSSLKSAVLPALSMHVVELVVAVAASNDLLVKAVVVLTAALLAVHSVVPAAAVAAVLLLEDVALQLLKVVGRTLTS